METIICPKISIVTPSKNTGKFVKETIESILAQTYKNWEHLVIDGGSTDETLDILRRYPHIRWLSEPDEHGNDAIRKGLAMAKGEYIMLCAFSDGYLNKNWFKICVETLDSKPEISLVWGIDQNMLEDGTLHEIVYNSWFRNPPPSGKDFIYHWLKYGTLFHERDLCVRKNVLKECFPFSGFDESGGVFFCNFNMFGYLPYFIPTIAAYGRLHDDCAGNIHQLKGIREKSMKKFLRLHEEGKRKIIKGEVEYRYRDGSGKLLPGSFNLKKYHELDKENRFKKFVTYLIPPIFIWFKNKLLARYRVYQNIKKIRKNLKRLVEDK